jgi:Domain of unknown function (DUF4351)
VREVDVYFQADRSIQPIPELGLLGQIAQTDFVLEPFRNPPTIFQIRACIGKLFDLHSNLIRETKRTKQPEPNNTDLPMLWILAPTLSKPILALESRVKALPLAQLEELGEALLDFSQMNDLVAWLDVDRA